MDRIGIAGLSIHGSDVAALELVRRPGDGDASRLLRDLADALGASEVAYLATCNRAEVVYAREWGDPPTGADLDVLARHLAVDAVAPLRERLVLRTGDEAVRHLFRVTSALDSLVLGDDQIVMQVREAFARSDRVALVGPLLRALFDHAFAVAKQVRTETDLARHPVSISTLGVAWLAERPDCAALRVAVVGAGEMGALLAAGLAAAGLGPHVIANRTLAGARRLAEERGARALTLEEFRQGAAPVDAIVSATSAPGVVLDAATLRALADRAPAGRGLLAIDLAVPHDVEPVEDARIRRTDLDALRDIAGQNRARRAEAAAAAEVLIERKLAVLRRRSEERWAAPVLRELREATDDIVARELARLGEGRLRGLSHEDRRAVERWARSAFGRLAQAPVATLKRLAATHASRDNGESAPPGEA